MTSTPENTPEPETGESTLAIMAFPDDRVIPDGPATGVRGKLHAVARYRRNPRSAMYMRALAADRLPQAEIVEVETDVPLARVAAAQHVVLLWADAIGYGWAPIERQVFRAKRPGVRVSALNGRQRRIPLTPSTLVGFRLRRLAERLWIGELALAAAMLLSAPALVALDLARGRR
jgi:hypothetical protein